MMRKCKHSSRGYLARAGPWEAQPTWRALLRPILIMQIVVRGLVQPLLTEWAAIRGKIAVTIDAAPVTTKDKRPLGAKLAARMRP